MLLSLLCANIKQEDKFEDGRRISREARSEILLRASKDAFIDIRLFMLYLLSAAAPAFTITPCLFLVSIRETNIASKASAEAFSTRKRI